MDIAAKLKAEGLVKYLSQRNISTLLTNISESSEFLEKFQIQELEEIVSSSKYSIETSLNNVRERHLEQQACLPILESLFQDRWTQVTNDSDSEKLIITVLKNTSCSQIFQKTSKAQREVLFSKEFLHQYSRDFENFSL